MNAPTRLHKGAPGHVEGPGWLGILPWLSLVLWLPLAVLSVLHLWFEWPFSGVRLARSLALLQGVELFPAAGEGWIQIALYGPVTALAFVPAVWVSSPAVAALLGQLLAAVYYFVPAALLIFSAGKSPKRSLGAGNLAAAVFFAVVTLDLWSLRYAALTVHADAPALALAGLACWSLLKWEDGRRGLASAALFAVLALWAKHVTIGVPCALTTFIAWRYGRAAFLRFAAWGLTWSAVSTAGVAFFFGPFENVFYWLVTVPGLHEWRWGGGVGALGHSAELLLRENPSVLLFAVVGLLLHLGGEPGGRNWRGWATRRPWLLLIWVALCQAPLAILGRAKIGGDVNAYSHALYFLLLGVVLMLRDASAPQTPGLLPAARRTARWLLYAMPFVTVIAVAAVQETDALARFRQGYALAEHPSEVAARYADAHPGQVYFPRLTLVTGLGEGRMDHQIAGLIDLMGAGKPPTPEHFRQRLPPRLESVVFYGDAMTEQVPVLEPYLDLERLPDDPALPGFWIYRASTR